MTNAPKIAAIPAFIERNAEISTQAQIAEIHPAGTRPASSYAAETRLSSGLARKAMPTQKAKAYPGPAGRRSPTAGGDAQTRSRADPRR